ncbi:MAG: HAMP domain-containing histidine kinase [Candidatus Obscuribacterales bacterium]|nr:HAMP domain-containing histidine kinase [Candidatus Obscuribacterales bacterium]
MKGKPGLSKDKSKTESKNGRGDASRPLPTEAADSAVSPGQEPLRDASVVVAEAAHELRLPIANIKLLVETLLDGALEDKEVCRRMLKRAYSEVDRLQALVADLLSLEQVAKRRDDLNCEWLSLKERAVYAIETVAKNTSEKNIQVCLDIADDHFIYANKGQLDQVILNLLENAVKFTPLGGKITIRSGEKPGSFCIEDNGIGMPASEIPKIFSKFYRIDKSISKGGTGLGLSIVKQVLDLHGAKITVKSQEGVGSCFELDFPSPKSGGRLL